MEKEIINLAKYEELEAKYREDFSKTLNPCYLALASSYRDIIEAKKYNIKFAEKEDELSL